jgi:hypothetical protein
MRSCRTFRKLLRTCASIWENSHRERLFQATIPSVQLQIAVLARRQQLGDFTMRPVIDPVFARDFRETPSSAGLQFVSKRAAERDHLAHQVRRPPRHFANDDAAERPPDQGDFALIAPPKIGKSRIHAGLDTWTRSIVRPAFPSVRCPA